jgi:hypothetical protein
MYILLFIICACLEFDDMAKEMDQSTSGNSSISAEFGV